MHQEWHYPEPELGTPLCLPGPLCSSVPVPAFQEVWPAACLALLSQMLVVMWKCCLLHPRGAEAVPSHAGICIPSSLSTAAPLGQGQPWGPTGTQLPARELHVGWKEEKQGPEGVSWCLTLLRAMQSFNAQSLCTCLSSLSLFLPSCMPQKSWHSGAVDLFLQQLWRHQEGWNQQEPRDDWMHTAWYLSPNIKCPGSEGPFPAPGDTFQVCPRWQTEPGREEQTRTSHGEARWGSTMAVSLFART